jgi:hypothetical protein
VIATTAQVATGLPEAARLDLDFDARRLAGGLETLGRATWGLQNTYSSGGRLSPAAIDWRVLPLRSVGGDPQRTDAGGPGLAEHAPTRWLDQLPYFAEVLDALPARVRSARLMALGPGAYGTDHTDTKHAPSWGVARLHVPVTTTAGARLYLDGHEHRWQPGSLWYGDFSLPHRVENDGPGHRVHLVVDALPTKELLDLFPAPARDRIDPARVLFDRDPVPLGAAEAEFCRAAFELPASFADWEEPEGAFLLPQRTLAARIVPDGAQPLLVLDGRPAFRLVHLGGLEFRLAGWTQERTLRVTGRSGRLHVELCTRAEDREHRAVLTAERR